MNERRNSNAGAWATIALAVGGALVFAIWQIGPGTLRNLAYILVVAVALALVIGAAAFPIRAYRHKDYTGETRILDGTRTVVKETKILDGRAVTAPEVKLLQLPAQPQGGAFPELLRAAYQSGVLANPRQRPGAPLPPGQDLDEIDLTSGDDWGGPIDA
jgi:hypothetical protein